ncbi:MAG: cupin domain-containing protein [Opitutales bacterium]
MSDPFPAASFTPGEIEVVALDQQPWYEADDGAIAREYASPRNARAEKLSIADIKIPAGTTVRPHYHREIEEIYHIVSGAGTMLLNGNEKSVGPGDTVVILPGERHGIRNAGPAELRMIVTCTPPWTPDCMEFD